MALLKEYPIKHCRVCNPLDHPSFRSSRSTSLIVREYIDDYNHFLARRYESYHLVQTIESHFRQNLATWLGDSKLLSNGVQQFVSMLTFQRSFNTEDGLDLCVVICPLRKGIAP